jgi:tungstate transport system permease protein
VLRVDAARSVGVSLTATLIAAGFALAGALWIVYGETPWRVVLLGVFNLGLGLPPVAVGLAVAFALWRSGPLGSLDLLYTPAAMIIA